jgi:Ca2+-binding RTX toxin-like protein/alpha-tubulin suppressor-like RCC1 family protein
MTVNVSAVNDAPTASNRTVTTNEDTARILAVADFGFSDVDAGNSLQSVTLSSIPTAGSLTLNGVAVTAGQLVSAADLAAGQLVFTPAANANGAGYASFGFKVSDGAALSAAYTMTADVSAVNDVPTVIAQGHLTVTPLPQSFPGHSTGEWCNKFAFAALRADGSLVTWGSTVGYSSAVAAKLDGTIDVTQVFSSGEDFAALRADGSVVTWGESLASDSHAVATALNGTIDVTQVFSSDYSFAALRADGSVVTWGVAQWGGDSSAVAADLNGMIDVTQVSSTVLSFAALRADGSVVTWGRQSWWQGPRTSDLDGTIDVTHVFSGCEAFAALRADGSVVTWGDADSGGDSSAVTPALNGDIDVTQVFSTWEAFAALRVDGSLVTWGYPLCGGNSSAVAAQIDGTIDVTQVFSNYGAFAALRADGSVVTWGGNSFGSFGSDSSAVASELNGDIDVTHVFSTGWSFQIGGAFAALRADGSVVTWGDANAGGDSSAVASALNGDIDVTKVFSTRAAFAALRADGSVVTWGDAAYGGDSSAVTSALNGNIDVTQVFSNLGAFAALRADGSVVTWGVDSWGGDSSAVASQLRNVVSLANAYTDDVYVAPTGSNPTIATEEDTARVLVVADFGFSDVDSGDTLRAVTVTSLPAAGSLKLNGVAVTASQSISVADITAGKLVFTPAANANGAGYASFGFKVSDGTALSASTYSMTVNVTPVRDDLTLTGGVGNDTLVGDLIDVGSYDHLIGLAGNDSLSGLASNDTLDGGAGNDTLNGGTGADSMTGGDGSDFYYVEDTGDVVTETNATASTGGTDHVHSSLAAYTLTANVENGRILSTTAANLSGNSGNNVLYAGAGDNVLNGSSGTDTVSYAYGLAGTTGVTVSLAVNTAQATGGSGSDTLLGIEHLIGSAYADKLTGNTGANILSGAAGNDTLDGGAGIDTMAGGDGSDGYYVRDSGDIVSETNATTSTGGNDIVYSTLAAYTLTANIENGRILSTTAANLSGNSGNNVLYAGAGNNVLNGGSGTDTVSYAYGLAGTTGVTVNLAASTAQATGGSGSDTLLSIENLIGSAYADRLTGNADANSLGGGAGNDTLDGGAGSDTLAGGDGSDGYFVRDGGDVVSETNADLATGGNDTVYSYWSAYTLTANVENGRILATGVANLTGNTLNNVLYAGAGNNGLDGGSGTDTVSYAYGLAGTTGVTVNLAVSTAQATGGSGSDTLLSIENLIGSAYADRLTGNTGGNSLSGAAGNDTLDGGTGIDTMAGGDGSDFYYVRDTGDVVSETNATTSTGGTDTVYSTLAAYTLTANVENGRILSTTAANLSGNSGNNVLYASAGNNLLDGGTGTDTVSYAYGLAGTTGVTVNLAVSTAQATDGSGSDTLLSIENLIGSAYADRLTGNTGNNALTGGLGKDVLTGSGGSDTFDFNALSEMGLTSTTWDVITDFAHGTDKIDLATLDADAALAGDQAFTAPVLGGTFSGVFASPGDLYFDTTAHVLYGNTDADTAAEFTIQLVGVTILTAADLFL